MKITYFSILAAAACGMAFGQTAYTTPVGYLSLTVPAGSDTTITPSLSRAPLLQGSSTSITGNVISIATAAANNAFINSGDPNAKTYVLVRSGALAGLRFPVTSNTGSTVTVNGGASTLQDQGFVGTDLVSVVPYWTLNTLFPGGLGVGVTADLVDATSLVLFSDQVNIAANRAPNKAYFYFGGDAENYPDYPAGWYDNDNLDGGLQDTVAIDPAVLMTIRNSPATSVTLTGEVPSVSLATKFLTSSTVANDELVGSPYPTDTTLQNSGLQQAIAPTTDLVDAKDTIQVYNDTATGLNKAPSKVYFYFAGDAENYPDYPAGWYDNDNLDGGLVTDTVLKGGRCFIIRKAPGVESVNTWTAPLPYTL